jgi:hypothetical protein
LVRKEKKKYRHATWNLFTSLGLLLLSLLGWYYSLPTRLPLSFGAPGTNMLFSRQKLKKRLLACLFDGWW